jgi:hypothetical protein
LVLVGYLQAQVAPATLRGTVTDATGSPLIGVRIAAKSAQTNSVRVAETSADGVFTISDLAPGAYQVTISLSGFMTIAGEIQLSGGEEKSANLTMRPGNGTQTIPTGSLISAGSVVDPDTVRDLPSNGRDWTQAATVQAGVAAVKTQPDAGDPNSGRGQRGFGAQMSISGARPQQNNYILNGTTINDYANSAPGSVLGLDLGADAVEQFSVMSNNYPADFGRSSGGVINAITRSGSNGFHGSLYEYLRNSALDARNFFDSATPPFRRNQYGATAAGAIRKDRTFFFANYEGLRQSLGVTQVSTVPSETTRAGLLSSVNVLVDFQAARYLTLFPLPNRGLVGSGDAGVFAFAAQRVTPQNYFTGRVDHKLNERDSLSTSYVLDIAETTQPDSLHQRLNRIQTRRNIFSLQERHVFGPDFLNFARFGMNRVVALIGQTPGVLNPLAADTSYGYLPGRTPGNINISGLTNFTGGLGAASRFDFHWTSFQFYDDTTRSTPNGSLRFGIAVERIRDDMLAASDPNGNFTFASLTEYLTNRPLTLSIALPDTIKPRDLRQTVSGGYVQQDWRLTARFTLNLGLRYETASVPMETQGRLAALRNLRRPEWRRGRKLRHAGEPE